MTVRGAGRRPSSWLAAGAGLALAGTVPLLALLLLLRRPSLDVRWEHHPAHFWLVLGAAALSALLAYATGEAAARRGDARLMYVSTAFLSASGFLGLHALATPGVLLAEPNAGFAIATPAGVALGSVFAVLSVRDVAGQQAVREVTRARRLRTVLILLMIAWAALSLLGLPPLSAPPTAAEGLPLAVAVPGVLLYLLAAIGYFRLWSTRREAVLLAVTSAYLLLGQALVAMVLSRNWHASWWSGTCSSCWRSLSSPSQPNAPGTRSGSAPSTWRAPPPAPVRSVSSSPTSKASRASLRATALTR